MERLTKRAVSVQGNLKTCCVKFNSAECDLIKGDCTHCSIEDRAWDRLADLEDQLESGELVRAEEVKQRCKMCPGFGLMAAHGNGKPKE